MPILLLFVNSFTCGNLPVEDRSSKVLIHPSKMSYLCVKVVHHKQTRRLKKERNDEVCVSLFFVFVRLPIYCVYTQFLNKISSFLWGYIKVLGCY